MNNLINVLTPDLWASFFSSIEIDARQIQWANIFGLVRQLALIMLLLMSLFFLRKFRVGMLPLFVTLATFPYLQAHLAITKYVDIYQNDFKVSAGSVVLFMATLFMVQLIYIYKDGIELRNLCTVIFCSIGLSTYLMYFFDTQGSLRQDTAVFGAKEEVVAWWVMWVGLLALVIDLLFLPCVYESTRWVGLRSVYWRILFTTLIVSWIDSFIFLGGSFYTQLRDLAADPDAEARIFHLFWAMGFGKSVACAVCSLAIWAYFWLFQLLGLEYKGDLGKPADVGARDLFRLFLYMIYVNNDYTSIRKKYSMDENRRVFMSRPFDSEMSNAAEYSERSGNPTCLVLVDVDDKRPGASRAGEGRGPGRIGADPAMFARLRRLRAGNRWIRPGVIEAVEKMVKEHLAVGATADAGATASASARIQPLIYVTNVDEIAVSLRDTSLAEGEEFAEAIRNGISSIEGTAAEGVTLSCGVAATDDSRDGRSPFYTMFRGRFPLEWRARMALDRDMKARLNGTWHPKALLFHLLQGKPGTDIARERLGTDHVGPATHPLGANGSNGTGAGSVMEIGEAGPAFAEAEATERPRSSKPGPTWEMVAALEEDNRKKDQRLRDLESMSSLPAGSSLVMEDEYFGSVNEEDDEDVVVIYRLPDGDLLSQVYWKTQFNRGPSPSRNENIITRVRIYKSPPTTNDEAFTDYELYPREKIDGRIKI